MYIYNSVSCLAHETFPPLGMFKRLSHGIVEGEMANERKKSAQDRKREKDVDGEEEIFTKNV